MRYLWKELFENWSSQNSQANTCKISNSYPRRFLIILSLCRLASNPSYVQRKVVTRSSRKRATWRHICAFTMVKSPSSVRLRTVGGPLQHMAIFRIILGAIQARDHSNARSATNPLCVQALWKSIYGAILARGRTSVTYAQRSSPRAEI